MGRGRGTAARDQFWTGLSWQELNRNIEQVFDSVALVRDADVATIWLLLARSPLSAARFPVLVSLSICANSIITFPLRQPHDLLWPGSGSWLHRADSGLSLHPSKNWQRLSELIAGEATVKKILSGLCPTPARGAALGGNPRQRLGGGWFFFC
eukprot:c3057_g1_i1.p1 GENE.c3057_g1_i1~~c3057_g1_i1.p1  ORF type:complete len:153 (-),score=7.90 c3057_g1_i1:28-486(-)